jgi:hypothetical protein
MVKTRNKQQLLDYGTRVCKSYEGLWISEFNLKFEFKLLIEIPFLPRTALCIK